MKIELEETVDVNQAADANEMRLDQNLGDVNAGFSRLLDAFALLLAGFF